MSFLFYLFFNYFNLQDQFNLNIDADKINFIQLNSWKLTVAET